MARIFMLDELPPPGKSMLRLLGKGDLRCAFLEIWSLGSFHILCVEHALNSRNNLESGRASEILEVGPKYLHAKRFRLRVAPSNTTI